MSVSRLPRIAITSGDVSGVGPELALRCLSRPEITQHWIPVLFGPAGVWNRVARHLNLPLPDQIELVDVGELDTEAVVPGRFDAATGKASYLAVDAAITSALSAEVDAIVTGPIQKEAWHLAGIEFAGHTEMLAERCGVSDICMMLTSESISCVLATIHIPLADVASAISSESVLRAIRLGSDAISARDGRAARVTVCGLNPHAGENGLFSHGEESTIIQPAIESARAEGYDVSGPLPPDTAFTPSMRKQTDVYVCMYHDQGLIPLKALAFDEAVNVTLGLPIVRTSVDHGTALNLAWQGTANDQSMLSAIRMAIDLCSSDTDE